MIQSRIPVASANVSNSGAETRRFGRSALVYLIPGVLARGISFFLTPIYTRTMAPEDFAIVAVANALIAVLSIALSFGLHGAVPRLCLEYKDQDQRKLFGTILSFSLVVPGALVALLFAIGAHGGLALFKTLQFHPHVELMLWTGLFSIYAALPTSVYAAREEPGKAATLSLVSAVVQLVAAIAFVAVLRQGAVGVLRAGVVANGLTALVSIFLMFRMSTFDMALPGLRATLKFSLPLVPHLAANWVLSISDRLVLERYVSPADLANYSLGYLFCLLVGLVASSVTGALSPMANRQLKDPQLAGNVPPLATYAMLIIVVTSLATALGAKEAVALVAPPRYAPAAAVVPWVVLGSLFQGVYFIVAIGTWFSMRTRWVPVITLIAASLNIGLNLALVPRFGFMAAAVSTFVCYAASAVMHAFLGHAAHPIAWEYRRWAQLFAVGGVSYALGVVPVLGSVWATVAWKAFVLLLLFPLGLMMTKFFSGAELERTWSVVRRQGP